VGSETLHTIRTRVAEAIGQDRFQRWFAESASFDLTQRGLSVTVMNSFVGEWIVSHYLDDLRNATRDVIGSNAIVDVKVDTDTTVNGHEDKFATNNVAPNSSATPFRTPETEIGAPRGNSGLRGRLESFIVGTSNQLAYSAAQAVIDAPSRAFRPLVVHGGCGLGKTHLLQGICNGVRKAHPTLRWTFISGEEFTNEFVYAVKSGRIDAFRARFRKVDLLVIDDLHFLANKKATQEEFLHTFNAIDGCGKTVVLSSDRHPREIAELSEPLINRLIAGMVVEIGPPDFAVRRAILQHRAATMEGRIRDDVLDLVAQRITRNVRELEGALFKLAALGSLMQQEVTPDLVNQVLSDYIVADHAPLQPVDVEHLVASYFDVSRERIQSRTRDRTVALARAVAMYLVRQHTTLSFPEIGRAMGGKNHSTVVMAVRRIQDTLDAQGTVKWKSIRGPQERDLQGVISELEAKLERGEAVAGKS
jgi:chromosomal replication initiator protein